MRGFLLYKRNIIKITGLVLGLIAMVLIGYTHTNNSKVKATTDPLASATISSGNEATGAPYQDVDVTGIQVSGVSDPSTDVPVQIYIPRNTGYLFLADTTGITLDTQQPTDYLTFQEHQVSQT